MRQKSEVRKSDAREEIRRGACLPIRDAGYIRDLRESYKRGIKQRKKSKALASRLDDFRREVFRTESNREETASTIETEITSVNESFHHTLASPDIPPRQEISRASMRPIQTPFRINL